MLQQEGFMFFFVRRYFKVTTVVDSFDCAQKIAHPEIESMKFYPVAKDWSKKISPHLDNPVLQRVLAWNFNKYTVGCWGKRFRRGDYPGDFDSSELRFSLRGRPPRYFQYVSHGACHWLVNFNLALAHFTEPKKAWRIVRSPIHSTVWDGEHTLFDLNGMAFFEGGAPECFRLAACEEDSKELGPGELLEVGLPWVDYAREIVGLRIKPLYNVRANNL
jgi:hypothetical protein